MWYTLEYKVWEQGNTHPTLFRIGEEGNTPSEATLKAENAIREDEQVGRYELQRVVDESGRDCYRGRAHWTSDLETNFNIGDLVMEEVVDDVINCLPPRTMTGRVVQMGEAYSHCAITQKPTYLTFTKKNGYWTYDGACLGGKTKEATDIYLQEVMYGISK